MSTTKDQIRRQAEECRRRAARADPSAGVRLAARFPLEQHLRPGLCVSGYVSFRSEIDPLPLLDRLASFGAQICLPRVESDETLTFRTVRGPSASWQEELVNGRFGLREPAASARPANPGLVLVPLLAFDGMGNRVGYGRGHYDRALGNLRANGEIFACGLAFEAQRWKDVPVEEHDEPLDAVCTEGGYYRTPV